MNEERYAALIGRALNRSAQDLPPTASRRLAAAREFALARQKRSSPEFVASSSFRGATAGPVSALKQGLLILALLFGAGIAFYWQGQDYIARTEEIDIALLADDLPPAAFLDQDFSAWIEKSQER